MPRVHTEEHLSEVFNAVASKRVMRMNYLKAQSTEQTTREIEPMGCYYHFSHWYLIGWCRLRNDYRTFKVKRIQAVEVLDEKFKTIHPSLNEYIEREAQEKKSFKVEVLFPKEMVEYIENDRFLFGLVAQEEMGTKVKMTFLVPDYFIIARWLLMYTSYAEIHSPPELMDVMRRMVQKLTEVYGQGQKLEVE